MPLARKTRTFVVVGALLILVFILLVAVLALSLNGLVRKGVEIGGSKVLGAPTTLQRVSIKLLRGDVSLFGLNVGNPEGMAFSTPTLFSAGQIHVGANPWELRKNQLHIREVILDKPELTVERANGKFNVKVLIDHLKTTEETPEKPKEKKEPLRMKIDLIRVTDLKAHIIAGGKKIATLNVGEIKLTKLEDKDGNGIPPSLVVRQLLEGLLEPVFARIEAPYLKKEFGDVRKMVGGIGDEITKPGEQIGREIKEFFKK